MCECDAVAILCVFPSSSDTEEKCQINHFAQHNYFCSSALASCIEFFFLFLVSAPKSETHMWAKLSAQRAVSRDWAEDDREKKQQSKTVLRSERVSIFSGVALSSSRGHDHTFWASRQELRRHNFVGCQISARHTSTIFKLCQPNCDAQNRLFILSNLIYSSSAFGSIFRVRCNTEEPARTSCILLQLKLFKDLNGSTEHTTIE